MALFNPNGEIEELEMKLDNIQKKVDMLEERAEKSESESTENTKYATDFAERLDSVIDLYNKIKPEIMREKHNVHSISEFLGFSSANELKKYYCQNEEPDFAMLSKLAKLFGVSEEWMKTGIGSMFNKPKNFSSDNGNIYNNPDNYEYKFALYSCNRSQLVICAKSNVKDFKNEDTKSLFYKTLCVADFHSDVGGNGMSNLKCLYDALKNNRSTMDSNAYVIKEDEFEGLWSGKICFDEIERKRNIMPYVMEDFLDLHLNEDATSKYTPDFYKVQRIIESIISQRS